MRVFGSKFRCVAVLAAGTAFQFSGCVQNFGRTVSSNLSTTFATAAVSVLQGAILQPLVNGILGDQGDGGAA